MNAPVKVPAPRRSASRARFEALYREIRERICLLRYPPGHKLGEDALAAEFGVSRTPIRRVLNRLEFEGLVQSRHGVGTIVTTIDPKLLREVYALRMRHAELVGELDPRAPGPAAIARCRELLARCRELRHRHDPEAFCRLNMAFFQEFAAAIGNRPLRESAERLYYQTARIWLQAVPEMDWTEEVEFFVREIEDTLSAFEAGDMRGAGLIRRNHVAMSLHRLDRHLRRIAEEADGGRAAKAAAAAGEAI